jgi:uncharacterized membrane protein YgcG
MSDLIRQRRITADQQLIAGVQQFLAQLGTLTLGSQKMAPADIVKAIQGRIDASNAAVKAAAALVAALQAEKAELTGTAILVSSLRALVLGMYAPSPEVLAVFGVVPRKRTAPSAATKAAAAAKSLATRKARGTLGKKQKQKIHGNVAAPAPAPAKPV